MGNGTWVGRALKFALLVVGAAVFIPAAGWGINWFPGEEHKTGCYVLKIQEEGVWVQTREAHLLCDGTRLEFTVETDEMASMVKRYKDAKVRVLVWYRAERFYSPTRSSSQGNFLDSIEPVLR